MLMISEYAKKNFEVLLSFILEGNDQMIFSNDHTIAMVHRLPIDE